MEIGGTSCDVTLMDGGEIAMVDAFALNDYHFTLPSVDIHSISGGGGTIATVDPGGLLQVGPHGAGARPGPACYGFGGKDATVTDAQVVLGRLRSGAFANGLIGLDAERARSAIERNVGSKLGLDAVTAASGVIRLLEQSLQHAIERVSVERGHDPRRFTLVAGGGAGALHAVDVARSLGCPTVYVPRLAGVFCAFGMCSTDIRQDFRATWLRLLSEGAVEAIEKGFAELTLAAEARLAVSGFALSDLAFERGFDLRYVGQQWPLQVPAPSLDIARIRADFEARHERQFGHHQPNGQIEIVHLRLAGIGRLARVRSPDRARTTTKPVPYARRSVHLGAQAGFQAVPIYDGNQLRPGQSLSGPAIIEERNTTILVGPDDRLEVDASDNFLIHVAFPRGVGAMIDDPIGLALVQKQLDHIARQMGWVMMRTARSPIFSQSHDFSCFIGDAHGNVVSQADGLADPHRRRQFRHQGRAQTASKDEIADGDVYILSDPYEAGGNHLPDWTIIRPVFVRGEMLAFCCNRAHQSDIGGGAAGTYNPAATEIFHEGIRLPVLASGGRRQDCARISGAFFSSTPAVRIFSTAIFAP